MGCRQDTLRFSVYYMQNPAGCGGLMSKASFNWRGMCLRGEPLRDSKTSLVLCSLCFFATERISWIYRTFINLTANWAHIIQMSSRTWPSWRATENIKKPLCSIQEDLDPIPHPHPTEWMFATTVWWVRVFQLQNIQQQCFTGHTVGCRLSFVFGLDLSIHTFNMDSTSRIKSSPVGKFLPQ